jgi:hypothetical protein
VPYREPSSPHRRRQSAGIGPGTDHGRACADETIAKKPRGAVVKQARVSKTFVAGKPQHVMKASRRSVVRLAPPKPSFGQLAGLHTTTGRTRPASSVALVMDQDTNEVLLSKNDSAVLPIASLTKMMTGLIISEAKLPMDEQITITDDDVDTEKHSSSRLKVGTTLSRGELMHLALMSSENRAAHALGRTYPGGMSAFVEAMNAKAQLLGMKDTKYVEPTGLSSRNQSSAQDLARLVGTASSDPMLREFSTSPGTRSRRQAHPAVQQHQPAGEEPVLGNRRAEDRLHQRSRPVPGDAGQGGRPQADHGVPGFRRQAEPHRRRRARAPLGRDATSPTAAASSSGDPAGQRS